MTSAALVEPFCNTKFDVVTCGAPPTPRPAQPFDCRPSLRAEYTSRRYVFNVPASTTTFLRAARPSPS